MREQDERLRKPKETEATEQASPSEPVETRIAADGGVPVGDAMSYAEDVRALALTGSGPDLSWEDRYVLALDAEVRRLREQLEASRTEVALMGASLKQQDEAARVLRVATEAAASKLSGKLARVEALQSKLDKAAIDAYLDGAPEAADAYELVETWLLEALHDEVQP